MKKNRRALAKEKESKKKLVTQIQGLKKEKTGGRLRVSQKLRIEKTNEEKFMCEMHFHLRKSISEWNGKAEEDPEGDREISHFVSCI